MCALSTVSASSAAVRFPLEGPRDRGHSTWPAVLGEASGGPASSHRSSPDSAPSGSRSGSGSGSGTEAERSRCARQPERGRRPQDARPPTRYSCSGAAPAPGQRWQTGARAPPTPVSGHGHCALPDTETTTKLPARREVTWPVCAVHGPRGTACARQGRSPAQSAVPGPSSDFFFLFYAARKRDRVSNKRPQP